jgi:hypothetical protein
VVSDIGDVPDLIEMKNVQASAPKGVAPETSPSNANAPSISDPVSDDKAEGDSPKTEDEGIGWNVSDDTTWPDKDVSLAAIMSTALAEKVRISCRLNGGR